MKKKDGLLWTLLFICIFLLSQDYLFMNWKGTPAVLGFPVWLSWFVFVHLLFITAFYFFAKKYWK